ncbi:MAG: hypothetical protein ACREGI_00715 [Candidatus Levyibacteriota bacterium]
MGGFGGFYKGEKKKKKQQGNKGNAGGLSSAPVFVMPKIIEKKKKNE